MFVLRVEGLAGHWRTIFSTGAVAPPTVRREAAQSATTLTVRVPFRLVKQGEAGRKSSFQMVDAAAEEQRQHANQGGGTCLSLEAPAGDRENSPPLPNWPNTKGIAAPYLTRTMRLAQLPPDVVEAILEGRQPRHLTLEALAASL
ncbi:MAG: hypothetical protein V9G18_16275 [Albidovulum sp.]